MRTPAMVLATAVAAAMYAHNAAAQPTRIMECRAEGLPEGPITAPGSYVLARNLSARGDCLVIEADFVTIDLAGFAITGNGTGTGIRADREVREQSLGIAVRNGTITGFMTGVRVRGSAIIEGMRVIGNTGVGIDTQRSIVTGNLVQDNDDDGIRADGTVNGNTSMGNGGAGIVVGVDSIVSGNTVTFNEDVGIFFSRGSTVIGNIVAENVGDGITTTFAPVSTVSGNTVRGNSENGISASEGSTVSGNTVGDNGEDGIIAGGTVSGNTALGNGNFGIVILCPSNVIGNTATGNSRNSIVLFGAELCNTIDNLPRF